MNVQLVQGVTPSSPQDRWDGFQHTLLPRYAPCDAENGDQLSINSKDKSAFDLQGMDIIALLQQHSAWLELLEQTCVATKLDSTNVVPSIQIASRGKRAPLPLGSDLSDLQR